MEIGNKTINFNYYHILHQSDNYIILNATFEEEMFKKFIPGQRKPIIQTFEKELTFNQKIYRTKSKEGVDLYAVYPLKQLRVKETYYYPELNKTETEWVLSEKAKTLCGVTAKFALRHNKTIVFCVNALKKLLDKYFYDVLKIDKERLIVDTYAWAIGKNEYRMFDGCVLFGTPFPNVKHKENIMKLHGVTAEAFDKREIVNKMIQAIFRIRPLSFNKDIDKKCEILCLSSVPIEEHLKFLEGHHIIEFSLKDFDKLFDDDYISARGKEIYNLCQMNQFGTMGGFVRALNWSYKTIKKEVDLLIEKGYLIEDHIDNGSGRGRSKIVYVATGMLYRNDQMVLKELEYDLRNDGYEIEKKN